MALNSDMKFSIIAKDRTKAAFSRVTRGAGRVGKAFLRLAAVGIAAAVAGLVLMVGKMTALGDLNAKTSAKLGLTNKALEQFQFAAELSGIKMATFNIGYQRFVRRMADARQGIGPGVIAFEALGVAVKTTDGELRKSDVVFREIAEALSNVENPAERVRLAFKLFDSEGVGMVNMLQDGAAGLKEMTDEAERLGTGLSQDAAANLEGFMDSMTRFKTLFKNIFLNLVAAMVPIFTKIADFFTDTLANAINTGFGSIQGFASATVNAFVEMLAKSLLVTEIWVGRMRRLLDAITPDDLIDLKAATRLEEILFDMRQGLIATARETNNFSVIATSSADDMNAAYSELLGTTEELDHSFEKVTKAVVAQKTDLNALQREITMLVLGIEKRSDQAAEATETAWTAAFQTIGDELSSFVQTGEFSFKSFLTNILKSIADFLINSLIEKFLGVLGGGGGKSGGAGGGVGGFLKGLFGFASGGSFKVGGAGGTDSQLVAFKASPNETVSVTRAGQSFGAGGVMAAITVVNHFEGSSAPVEEQKEAAVQIEATIKTAVNAQLRHATRPGGFLNQDGRRPLVR